MVVTTLSKIGERKVLGFRDTCAFKLFQVRSYSIVYCLKVRSEFKYILKVLVRIIFGVTHFNNNNKILF